MARVIGIDSPIALSSVRRYLARPLVLARMELPAMDAGDGAFVGYFAVGEGGALFVHANGERGARAPLFDEAISAMMRGNR